MGLMSGFKSLFVGDDDLEQEDEFDSIYDTNDRLNHIFRE